jgi:hypothetical protein
MSGSISIAEWLIHIQGKNISESILQSIKAELVGITTSSKKMLYDSIVGIINKNGYTVDPKYVYENILGLHIAPLDLATENIIIREFEVIRELIGDRGCKQVPNAYMLQKISEKYNLTIGNTVDFPVDRKRHYDIILTAYIHNQAS